MATELTTYAQNREDLYTYALLNNVKKGFYVDVGANHEQLHSVTKMFYELGWKGINIEPNKKLIAELRKKRKRDINLQVGVSDKTGEMSFREFPDFDGLSTLSEDIKELYKDRDYAYRDYSIPVDTLANIFRKNKIQQIDFLKVDVEGHEFAVLEGNDWKKYRPTVVLFEGTDGQRCIKYLEDRGYLLEFFDGLNYYMIDSNIKGVTIHSFAGSVLANGLYTEREKSLLAYIDDLERRRQLAEKTLSELRTAINDGLGVKTSAKSLAKSVKRKIKKN